jgi:hypothetical protein
MHRTRRQFQPVNSITPMTILATTDIWVRTMPFWLNSHPPCSSASPRNRRSLPEEEKKHREQRSILECCTHSGNERHRRRRFRRPRAEFSGSAHFSPSANNADPSARGCGRTGPDSDSAASPRRPSLPPSFEKKHCLAQRGSEYRSNHCWVDPTFTTEAVHVNH